MWPIRAISDRMKKNQRIKTLPQINQCPQVTLPQINQCPQVDQTVLCVLSFFFAEYTGIVVPIPTEALPMDSQLFLMQHTTTTCVDATNDTGFGRKINHSRQLANCYTRTEQVLAQWRVFLYAKRTIYTGEELFYDYRTVNSSHSWTKK
jgi:hypothetical protein